MSEKTLLSIVTVSAFDVERLLKTIKSLNKIPSEIEHVVVLPNIDYKSIELLNSICKNSPVSMKLVHDKNNGVYEAMNIGVSESNGDYVCFWNSGDELVSPDTLSELINFIKMGFSKWYISQVELGWRDSQIMTLVEVENFVLQKFSSFISHQSVIVKKDLFLKMGGFNLKYKVAADTDQISKMYNSYKPVFFQNSVVRVEIPNFASKHHRRARVEVLFIAFRNFRGRRRLIAIKNIFLSEITLIRNRLVYHDHKS